MPRPKIRTIVLRLLVVWVTSAAALLLMSWLLSGFHVDSFWSALGAAALIGLVNALVWPTLIGVALPFTVLTLGLGVLVLNGLVVWLVAEVAAGVTIDNVWTGIVVAIGLTVVGTLGTSLLAIDDDNFYDRNVIRRQARKHGAVETDVPALYLLEIDGLAHAVLMRAIRDGNAPTMARWINDGSHHLIRWECDWSSQTGAAQTGILHGTNEDIPAFRWWDKEAGREVSSSRPRDVAAIEERISNGKGLLYADGASRANMYSGDAPYSLLTMSTVLRRDRPGRIGSDYFAYFANPYNLTRTIALVIADISSELWQAAQQKRLDIRPRVHRGLKYSFVRAWTTVVQRDLQVASVVGDIFAGRPVLYTTFTGYDEVAHHSGIERPETLKILRKLDRQFARLERAAAGAPRPVRFAVLSDHGQTQGTTFRDRYGISLPDLVTEATSASVQNSSQGDEGLMFLGASLTEASGGTGVLGTSMRTMTKGQTVDGAVLVGPDGKAARKDAGQGGQGRGTARGRRDGLGLPRPRLLPARARPCHPRVDRRELPEPDPGVAEPPGDRLRARSLRGRRCDRARRRRDEFPRSGPRRRRRPARAVRPERGEARQALGRVPALWRPDDQLDVLGRDGRGGGVRGARRLARRDGRRAGLPVRTRSH